MYFDIISGFEAKRTAKVIFIFFCLHVRVECTCTCTSTCTRTCTSIKAVEAMKANNQTILDKLLRHALILFAANSRVTQVLF